MADLPEKLLPLVVLNILMPATCCEKNMVKTERSIENKYLYLLSLWYNLHHRCNAGFIVVAPYLLSLWYNESDGFNHCPVVVAPYLLSLWYNRQKIRSRKTQLFRVPFPQNAVLLRKNTDDFLPEVVRIFFKKSSSAQIAAVYRKESAFPPTTRWHYTVFQ